jgi:predicted lipoprotein with Yx(FWY)xxD motif
MNGAQWACNETAWCTTDGHMHPVTSLIYLAGAALIVGCGQSETAAQPPAAPVASTATATATATPAPARAAQARRGVTVRAVRSQFGTVIANRAGKAFYLFDKERSRRSECYGDCAEAWPPVVTKGRPIVGRGIRADLLGTTRRRDGRLQVTYRGRPMYYYVADAPGRILCQNVVEFGGRWLVVKPDGRPVL